MKIFKKLFLFGLILLILLVAVQAIYWAVLNKQLSEQVKLIQKVSNSTHIFTFNFRSHKESPREAITFEIPTERDVQLHIWATSLLGNIDVLVIDSNGETMFRTTAERSNKAYPIHLEAGQYRVVTRSFDAFSAGGVVGIDYLSYYIAQIPVLPDADLDDLPDKMEESARTKPNLADTDGDALSDYAEVIKYKTDPLQADSDGDGIPDNHWNEQREYAYTVRVLIKLREPFDLEAMNDLYQDVRVVAEPDEAGYTTLEAIIYPETHPVLTASSYPLEALSGELQSYMRPGIASNYDADMQAKVRDIVAGSTTDIQVVERVLEWVRGETSLYLDYSIPEVYFTYLDGSKVQVRNYSDPLPVDELLRTHYFAASMFKERTHGTCTSIANLRCTMLRAAGIPCRLIQTLFPIYYHEDQTEPYTNNLRRKWDNSACSYEYSSGEGFGWANHAFMEVYLGKQWIRVDEDLGIFHQQPRCLSLKFLSVADWSEADFSETWPVDWIHNRPYYTILIEDQEPQK